MDSRLILQAGTQPKGFRGEHRFLITLIIIFVAGLFVLLAATCTLWSWSIRPISTTHDQSYLYVPQPRACHTDHRANHIAHRDQRGLTGRVRVDNGSNRMELRRSIRARLHPVELYGINTYLALSLNHDKAFNRTRCWVCTRIPHSAVSGIPLFAIPFDLSECCGYWIKMKEWSERDNNTNHQNKDLETGWLDQIVTSKDRKCPRQQNFSGWFWPSFNLSERPPYFVEEQTREKPNLCLVQEAWEERRKHQAMSMKITQLGHK